MRVFTVQFEAQFHNPSANTNKIVELEIILHEKSVVKYKVSFLTWGASDNHFFFFAPFSAAHSRDSVILLARCRLILQAT